MNYYLENNSVPICKICNKEGIYFSCERLGSCCSKSCQQKNTYVKSKETLFKKYNITNSYQIPKIKNNCKIARSNPNVQLKLENTNLKNIGVKYPQQSIIIRDKTKQTCKEKYGVDTPFESMVVKEKFKQTFLKKYNVEHPSQVPEIHEKQQASFKSYIKKHKYTLNNKQYNIQGYEPQCLNYLINIEKIKENDIALLKIEGKPSIKYFNVIKNKNSIYHPDIYIKSQNRIIEVKSEYTYNSEKQEIEYKIKGCLEANYFINVYILNKDGTVLQKI